MQGGRFQLVGSANVTYRTIDRSCGVIPDPLPTPAVFPGGTVTGNLCWQVPSAEVASLALSHAYTFPKGDVRTWFAIL
jgi:hypothetical protein